MFVYFRDVLQRGGNAVDAAIAALFCDGVSMPHSMGLGGGFLLTLYNKSTGEVWSLNSREVAPGAATVEMFQDDPRLAQTGWVLKIFRFFIKVSSVWFHNSSKHAESLLKFT